MHNVEAKVSSTFVPLQHESLQKCKEVLQYRKSLQLKYSNIVLPETYDEQIGYHVTCYRKFTALSKAQRKKRSQTKCNIQSDNAVNSSPATRSNTKSLHVVSSYGGLPKICVLCQKERKVVKGKEQPLICASTQNLEDNIRNYINLTGCEELRTNLAGGDFVAKDVLYHSICRTRLQNKARKNNPKLTDKTEWHDSRDIWVQAFNRVCEIVDDVILGHCGAIQLCDLNTKYEDFASEMCNEQVYHRSSTRLAGRLLDHFKNKIKIFGLSNKIICPSYMEESTARKHIEMSNSALKLKIRDVAFALRSAVRNAPTRNLPCDLKVEDLALGEIDTPELLLEFLTYLIADKSRQTEESISKQCRIRSIGDDVVFATLSGRKKPGKHLELGLAIKSLTGSDKILRILNKYGHSASYSTVEELETELVYQSDQTTELTPHGMNLGPQYATGLAFDNYDRFVETLSGQNTLHDTVGIAYQMKSQNVVKQIGTSSEICESSDNHNNNVISNQSLNYQVIQQVTTPISHQIPIKKRRRRAYIAKDLEIEPYKKRPKLSSHCMMPANHPARLFEPASLPKAHFLDKIWMLKYNYQPTQTPMWIGFNSLQLQQDDKPQQIIRYLPQLNQSPTSTSVVAELLNRSLIVMNEQGKTAIAVTFDLAIAKIAMQIQKTDSPRFDQVFVNIGAFHIEMAFFAVIGKYIAESGGPYILSDCHIIEQGSLNGFLSGKSYSRCRRVHQILSISFEILHFRLFLSTTEIKDENQEIEEDVLKVPLTNLENTSELLKRTLKLYEKFTTETRNGQHGKTAQYWIGYLDMIQLYRDFVRSVRVGDLKLYMCCIPKLTAYFFRFNHPNYARYLVYYHDCLIKLKSTHPQVYKEFEAGNFSLRRTEKRFSGLPIDLSLEQTINADSASRHYGLHSLTNSIGGRQRWARGNFIRTQILSALYERLNLKRYHDIATDIRPKRIEIDNKHVKQVIEAIENSMNPFSKNLVNEELFNLASGRALKESATIFLLNCFTDGVKMRDTFITECVENSQRFEKPIKRVALQTFGNSGKVVKTRGADGKVMKTCMERDLFGSILYLSVTNNIDLPCIFSFPLTPIPLSLAHIDGGMLKTPKAKLLKELEQRIESDEPPFVDVYIADGFFFLHLFVDIPSSFGALAKKILTKLCSQNAREIHILFDKYQSPSVKDVEHGVRQAVKVKYRITGGDQKTPSNWQCALNNISFKQELVDFLLLFWSKNECVEFLGNKTIYMNVNNNCFKFKNEQGIMIREDVASLYCTHDEADSRMIFHAANISWPANVVLRTNDTDVLIIALGCMHNMPSKLQLWMEVGTYYSNNLRYINISSLAKHMGDTLCRAMPAYHAFTGCDYTASFYRKGKVRPLRIMENHPSILQSFANVGETYVNDESFEKLVCLMYGMKNRLSVNEARTDMFYKKFKPKRNETLLSVSHKFDGSSLPPCKKVLVQKMKRCNFVTQLWKSSFQPCELDAPPVEHGWRLEEDQYTIHWYDGECRPPLSEICQENNVQTQHKQNDFGKNMLFYK